MRDFLIYTDPAVEEEENDYLEREADLLYFDFDFKNYLSYSEKKERIGEADIWYFSEYPGFSIKNNKLHYEQTKKSKVQNSTKEELTTKIYTLDHIPYQTIVCEGCRFYINNYLRQSAIKPNIVNLDRLSGPLIWSPVFKFLLWRDFSSSMKNMLESQNYRKKYERRILKAFCINFQILKESPFSLKERLSGTERSVFEERLLNVFLFSGISEKKIQTLLTNFFLTESLDEIISFYQELLSQFETGIN